MAGSPVTHRCPYCGSGRGGEGPERKGARYRICLRCRSGYVAESRLQFHEYYERYDPEGVQELPQILRRRYADVLGLIERHAPGRRLLEVGCGNGHFLSVARERGWEVRGNELSRPHVERARAAGLDVVYGDLADDGLWEGEPFDAAVLIEVLEHVPEPAGLLRAVTDRLVPEGVTYLTTPNFGSISRRILRGEWSLLDHEHVALASPEGLRLALERAGQRVLRLRSKHIFLGEYRRVLFPPRPGTPPLGRVESTAQLRDRIEASWWLRAAKVGVNAILGMTGLGESQECLARRAAEPS